MRAEGTIRRGSEVEGVPYAILYLRISDRKQVGNHSIATQREVIRRWLETQGLSRGPEFVDEAESAKTIDRPAFQELLGYCRKHSHEIACIVVFRLDRFTRELYDYSIVRHELDQLDIPLRSATESIDDGEQGETLAGIQIVLAQADNRLKSRRSKLGMRYALSQGQWVWRAPIGYLNGKDTDTQRKTLIPDPARANLIRRGYELMASENYSSQQALDAVHKLGLVTGGGRRVSKQTWSRVLRNPIYSGRIVSPKWGIGCNAAFPALVDRETFARAQRVLDGRRISPTQHAKNSPEFPLRRFCRCKECGKGLTAGKSRGRSATYGYYRCWNCGAVNVRRRILHGDFEHLLGSLRPDEATFDRIERALKGRWSDREHEALEAQAAHRRHVLKLRAKRERLLERFGLDGLITERDFRSLLAKVDREIHDHEAQTADLGSSLGLDLAGLLDFARGLLTRPYERWTKMPCYLKQRFQVLLFPCGLAYHRKEGLGTAATCMFFSGLETFSGSESQMVPPRGLDALQIPIDRWFPADGPRRAA